MAAARIAVMGAGTVGGYFGGRLAQAGEAVAFVARGAHLGAIQAAGWRPRDGAATDDAPRVVELIGPLELALSA